MEHPHESDNATAQRFPKAGEKFRCEVCGMEIQVTRDCHCEHEDDGPHFHCCGRELTQV